MSFALFYEDGHLTDEALQALIREEELDTLQRLEISEHLSFCDLCTLLVEKMQKISSICKVLEKKEQK